jgi:hypothetical protein
VEVRSVPSSAGSSSPRCWGSTATRRSWSSRSGAQAGQHVLGLLGEPPLERPYDHTAPLHGLVAAMLTTGADVHVLRHPIRGGLAASLNEIAREAGVGEQLPRIC